MKQLFKYYDTDTDGHLTRTEASALYREMGYIGSDHWAQKRIPMEDFLLKCGAEKKNMMEAAGDEMEYRAVHAFRIIDNPRTGTINQHKLSKYLKEIDVEIADATIERIAELISSSDEAEFTEEDLFEYIRANLKMGHSMANSLADENESLGSA
eukprot:CAMPEP_0197553996 /NCGR_PEP_ID=MMETSP1320-20131121/10363_1 /TAXON_ID=91990 /ORGANISM="Bolidomonas sp., Strain RCC2347" /LENGTH=153 /DNA_ID=CAMNT_0043114839 /DNA_START=237 /DNA_END=698 /DNA_ORIENTATION=+